MNCWNEKSKSFIFFLYGEAVNLKLKDVKSDRIFVTGKGQKEREIYLPSEVKNAIDDYLIERTQGKTSSDKDYLFTTKIGRKMSYDYFRKICKRVSMNSGIKFHPHMARQTYATELLKKGLSVFYVARLLGHEDLSSTQIYLHASQEDAIYEVSKIKLFENGQKQNDLNGKDRLGFGPK